MIKYVVMDQITALNLFLPQNLYMGLTTVPLSQKSEEG